MKHKQDKPRFFTLIMVLLAFLFLFVVLVVERSGAADELAAAQTTAPVYETMARS